VNGGQVSEVGWPGDTLASVAVWPLFLLFLTQYLQVAGVSLHVAVHVTLTTDTEEWT
jgi:hypothetical protein